ncbi:hypothetical protein C8J57DRAFT_1538345 [Mycena rebaudengoi]|nr:hypothetical protein C8J57DRAFT_1538345 [Mycena rebaudengoi]
MGPQWTQPKTLIRFITKSSCSLRHLELEERRVGDEQEKCFALQPCLETLVVGGGDSIFAATASPVVLPSLCDPTITTRWRSFNYSSLIHFLSSRRNVAAPLRSLQINLDLYDDSEYEATPAIRTILAHGAEMSIV